MPSTLRVTPVTPFMRHYIARHRNSINSVGQLLGVPPIAIAGALTEEMRNVYPDHGTKVPTDMIADQLVVGLRSHRDIAKDFSERLADILVGAKPSLEDKISHATANDIGPGNINFGQAILQLRRYLNDSANAKDPLRLRQYTDDYKTFAKDLISLNSGAPPAIAGLILKQGISDYDWIFGTRFTNAPLDVRSALLTTYYKQGQDKFRTKHPSSATGQQLPDPRLGDGGPFVLEPYNFQTLDDALNGRMSYDGVVPRDPIFQ